MYSQYIYTFNNSVRRDQNITLLAVPAPIPKKILYLLMVDTPENRNE